MNIVKEKLKNKEVALGGWLLSGSPVIAEAMAPSFDWVAIDLEHGNLDRRQTENCIRAIHSGCAEPFVRVQSVFEAPAVLDMGATGIIFPNVMTADNAKYRIESCLFPPAGTRSYSLARATHYGREFEDYFATANDDTVLVAMIEHIDAVKGVEEIVTTPGIDAILIGPYDLSGSMGHPGEFNTPDYDKAYKTIKGACLAHEMAFGIHNPDATEQTAVNYTLNDMRFFAVGMDTTSIIRESEKITKRTRREEDAEGKENV